VQPIRRIPYRLREKLEKKLREDEQYDIVEMVEVQFASLAKLDLSLQLQRNQHVHIYHLLKH
jgi:hypothetical protein